MKTAAKILLIPLLFLICWEAQAQVEWSEPEVVPEKLVRNNRRVLRFRGSTEPGGQIRIRKNRVKLYLDSGKSRWAQIPQKNSIQFPVVADGNGEFTFDLYLPTVAVEIPVEVYKGGKWIPYSLNFRVPDEGAANDFQAVEESFRATEDEPSEIDKTNYYSEQKDKGQYIRDRERDIVASKSPVEVYGGGGLSYFSTTVKTPNAGVDVSESTIIIPSWKLGVNWDVKQNWRAIAALRSSSGSIDVAGFGINGAAFNWLEFQLGGQYFMDSLRFGGGRLGLDFGFGLQSLPLFRERSLADASKSFFDNDVYAFHLGLQYETDREGKDWPYEFYARYFYPLSSGDAFDIKSSFPMLFEFGGGLRKQITPGLALGVYGQMEWFSMEVSYLNTGATDLSLMLFTVDVRLIANF